MVGVLIEVPVMLSVVYLVKRSAGWYQAGAQRYKSSVLFLLNCAERDPDESPPCGVAHQGLAPVHPHASGEHAAVVGLNGDLFGSSPREWGTPHWCGS